MTTVVYQHSTGIVAYDSRVSSGGLIQTDTFQKMSTVGKVRFFLTGSLPDLGMMQRAYLDNSVDLSYCSPHNEMLVLDNGKCYSCGITDDKIWKCHIEWDVARGSGSPYALSALDLGLTPRAAVKYATTRDVYSGGTIRQVKL